MIKIVSFGERIRELARKLGKEEQNIAKELGLTKSQLSHYINGNRKVPSELLQKIVDTYKINPLFLFRENASLYIEDNKGTKESPYTYYPEPISAGLPLNVSGITNADKINIPDVVMGKYSGKNDIYITKVNGESMNKIIPHDSLIAVKPVNINELKDNDIVVYSDNHEYSVKRFFKSNNEIWFRPHSTDFRFKDNIYNINNTENLQIHGKVVVYVVEMD